MAQQISDIKRTLRSTAALAAWGMLAARRRHRGVVVCGGVVRVSHRSIRCGDRELVGRRLLPVARRPCSAGNLYIRRRQEVEQKAASRAASKANSAAWLEPALLAAGLDVARMIGGRRAVSLAAGAAAVVWLLNKSNENAERRRAARPGSARLKPSRLISTRPESTSDTRALRNKSAVQAFTTTNIRTSVRNREYSFHGALKHKWLGVDQRQELEERLCRACATTFWSCRSRSRAWPQCRRRGARRGEGQPGQVRRHRRRTALGRRCTRPRGRRRGGRDGRQCRRHRRKRDREHPISALAITEIMGFVLSSTMRR